MMKDKKLEATMKKLNEANISERNKELIKEFLDDCKAERLSKWRLIKYTTTLRIIAGMLGKDFEKATKKDIKEVDW